MEIRDPASSSRHNGGANHFVEDDEDDDGDGLVWPTLSLSPRFQHIPPPPPPIIYGPFFEPEFPTNISVLAGQTVLLQCRVMDLGDRVVSWVRQSDLAILASGGVSHTSDNRITASADETLTDWELQIAEAQTKDSGLYECQVNTEPKINWPVTVHVEAALASIVGTSELYVRTGSTISLTCIIQGSGSIPPRVLFWFHNSKPIALDSPRGGISLETERTVTGMSSKLLLTRAALQDGGNYTCAPPGAQPADVTVHVLNGEHPAAMQRGNRSPSTNGAERAAHLGAKCLWAVQNDGPKCDGTVSTRGVDRSNRQVILQTHNTLRSIVASGQESRGQPGPQPRASNMQMMTWDDELATVAQRLAEQCLFEHDCNECRKVGRFPVGQNLAVEWTTGPPLPTNWKKQVTRWYEEVEEFPNTSARKFEFSVVTGHYSQIIWADTNRVGCGFTSFRDNGTFETNLYVCNYGPAGNFVGLPSYKVGEPCSQCPANTACSTRFPNLCESTKKNPESSVESPAEELSNEILPRPTGKPIRPPSKVMTSSGSVVQRPPHAMAAAPVTERPTVNKPVIVTQSPVMQKPIVATQGPIMKPTSPQLSLPALANNRATVQKDFVCQVGRGACRAVFKGTAWSFRPQPSSVNQSHLETRVPVGQLTELQINQSFPAPIKNAHVCLSFQMKQRVEIDEDEEERSWVIPPLLIKIQPEKSQSVVVPISSGVESKWIQVKLAASRIRTPFKLHFQQTGPRSEDKPAFSSRTNLQMVLGELRIFNGNCTP